MLELDEDALICDLAEAYGIFDYESLPLQTVATLSIGLRGDSRIKMKMIGAELTRSELLQTVIADYLALILWSKTKDGQKGRNKPKPRCNNQREEQKGNRWLQYARGLRTRPPADFE